MEQLIKMLTKYNAQVWFKTGLFRLISLYNQSLLLTFVANQVLNQSEEQILKPKLGRLKPFCSITLLFCINQGLGLTIQFTKCGDYGCII